VSLAISVAQTGKLNRGAALFAVAKAKVSRFATQKPAAVFRDDTSER
jgi:hypothetical protein